MTALERVQKEANERGLGLVEKKYYRMLRGYWLNDKIYLASRAEVAIAVLVSLSMGTYRKPRSLTC